MTLPTPVAFVSVLYLGGAAVFGYPPDWFGAALAAVASVVPDIDLPTSKIGRLLFFFSVPLERRFGHRALTHSAVALLAVAALASPLLWAHPPYFAAIVGGYWSHLWLDMFNIRGIDLFWPSARRVVMPGNRNWRLEVGSKGEMILLGALVIVTAALYPVSRLGLRDSLQSIIASFEIAREQYLKQAGVQWYALELEAIDNLTLQRVRCRCPLVGVWQGALIVLHEDKLRTVGENPARHDLHPIRSRLIPGEPLTVVTQRIAMKNRTLSGVLDRLEPGRTVYLLGELRIDGTSAAPVENLDQYRPVTEQAQRLRLHYARPEDVGPWRERVALDGEVFVQVWLKPGDAPVTVQPAEDPPAERIPEQLRRFL